MTAFDPENIKPTAIAATGESDRSPEFKSARAKLINDIDSWLLELARKRESGEALVEGVPTSETPRIEQTDLGPSGPGMRAVMKSKKRGVSLTGDGVTGSLIFQQVKDGEEAGTLETTEVRGSDPLAEQFYGDGFTIGRQLETIVSFGTAEETGLPRQSRYFSFTVTGDGRVKQQYRRNDGMNVSQELRTAAELQVAQLAFETIARTIS